MFCVTVVFTTSNSSRHFKFTETDSVEVQHKKLILNNGSNQRLDDLSAAFSLNDEGLQLQQYVSCQIRAMLSSAWLSIILRAIDHLPLRKSNVWWTIINDISGSQCHKSGDLSRIWKNGNVNKSYHANYSMSQIAKVSYAYDASITRILKYFGTLDRERIYNLLLALLEYTMQLR